MPSCQFSLSIFLQEYPYKPLVDSIEEFRRTSNPENFIKTATEYIRILPEGRRPRRGDTVSILPDHYRNEDVFFWTGEKIIDQANDIDEYGHVPNEFWAGEEFPFNHWDEVICHNSLIPVRPEFLLGMKISSIKVPPTGMIQFCFHANPVPWIRRNGVGYINREKLGEFPELRGTLTVDDLPKLKELIEQKSYECTYHTDPLIDSYEVGDDLLFEGEVHVIFS